MLTACQKKKWLLNTFISILSQCTIVLENNGKIKTKLVEETFYSFSKKIIIKEDNAIFLSPQEILLIELFLNNPNRLITFEEIDIEVYKNNSPTVNALNTLVSKLRKKIGQNIIKAIPSHGYQLVK